MTNKKKNVAKLLSALTIHKVDKATTATSTMKGMQDVPMIQAQMRGTRSMQMLKG